MTIVLAFSFTSCSTNETDIEIPQEALLRKAKFSRDASGSFAVDYVVADNTASDVSKNVGSLTNEINLSKSNQNTKNSHREEFTLENNKLNIGFIDAESGKQTRFIVDDKNIILAKGEESKEFLKNYSWTLNSDGTLQLEFDVNVNVNTEFVLNEELDIYEVHLSRGMNSESSFSRTINIPDNGVLKIDFVNHKKLGKGLTADVERHPRGIIITN